MSISAIGPLIIGELMVQTNTLISDALVPPPTLPAGQQQQAFHLITGEAPASATPDLISS